jgi:hypothetical protein
MRRLAGRVPGSALDATTRHLPSKRGLIGSNLAEPYGLHLASLSPTLRALDDGTFLRGGRALSRKPLYSRQRACAADNSAIGRASGLGAKRLLEPCNIVRIKILVFADYSPSEMQ